MRVLGINAVLHDPAAALLVDEQLEPGSLHSVPHHVAHAAQACLAAPFSSCAALVADRRGVRTSCLSGRAHDGLFDVLARQELPHSLGLLYEELTQHLGFAHTSDEAFGTPWFLPHLRELVQVTDASPNAPGFPVVINASLNTAGRPMVDRPRNALECFGSAPIDALALRPYLNRRPGSYR